MAKSLPVRMNKTGGGFIKKQMQSILDSWAERTITGSLKVRGHDYWWILEYGSGTFFEVPDGALTPPASIPEAGRSDPWLTAARDRSMFSGSKFRGTQGRLKFAINGMIQFAIETHPHGQGARVGHIRRCIRQFDESLRRELAEMKRLYKGRPPYRYEVVAVVNSCLDFLLANVKAGTPLGPTRVASRLYGQGPDTDGHLRDAWTVTHPKR